VVPPFGVLGGASAAPVDSFVMRDGQTMRFATPGKVGGFPLRAGDVVVLQSAGGGGYGDPLDRPAADVAADITEGYVTAARARQSYGVVLGADGGLDAAATAALRRDIRARRVHLAVIATAEPLYQTGRYSRYRICRLHPADADRLGVVPREIVELVGGSGPALRAWVVLDAAVERGTVPLDRLGQSVVGAKPGDSLYLRPLGRIEVS
jgi:N-methylhydantoinase B